MLCHTCLDGGVSTEVILAVQTRLFGVRFIRITTRLVCTGDKNRMPMSDLAGNKNNTPTPASTTMHTKEKPFFPKLLANEAALERMASLLYAWWCLQWFRYCFDFQLNASSNVAKSNVNISRMWSWTGHPPYFMFPTMIDFQCFFLSFFDCFVLVFCLYFILTVHILIATWVF